jgi:hypothetical protein
VNVDVINETTDLRLRAERGGRCLTLGFFDCVTLGLLGTWIGQLRCGEISQFHEVRQRVAAIWLSTRSVNWPSDNVFSLFLTPACVTRLSVLVYTKQIAVCLSDRPGKDNR